MSGRMCIEFNATSTVTVVGTGYSLMVVAVTGQDGYGRDKPRHKVSVLCWFNDALDTDQVNRAIMVRGSIYSVHSFSFWLLRR